MIIQIRAILRFVYKRSHDENTSAVDDLIEIQNFIHDILIREFKNDRHV